MARKAYIPITDHEEEGVCSLYYTVKFKLSSSSIWTTLSYQEPILYGSPAGYAILIDNLEDDLEYDYEITRHCCEGVNSSALTGTFETTL